GGDPREEPRLGDAGAADAQGVGANRRRDRGLAAMAQRPAAAADRRVRGASGRGSGCMTAAPALVAGAGSIGAAHTRAAAHRVPGARAAERLPRRRAAGTLRPAPRERLGAAIDRIRRRLRRLGIAAERPGAPARIWSPLQPQSRTQPQAYPLIAEPVG